MNPNLLRAALAAAGLAAVSAVHAQPACKPLETREANAPEQKPAFAGQTRACGVQSNIALDVTVMAKGLVNPWAVEPLPDGSVLVTEKAGRMRVITKDGRVGEPLKGLPEVHARGQGGLLDVTVSPSTGASPSRARTATAPASPVRCCRRTTRRWRTCG
jgi:aldose sugar dehydrogenase